MDQILPDFLKSGRAKAGFNCNHQQRIYRLVSTAKSVQYAAILLESRSLPSEGVCSRGEDRSWIRHFPVMQIP